MVMAKVRGGKGEFALEIKNFVCQQHANELPFAGS